MWIAGAMVAMGLWSATAHALTFTVNSTTDEVDASPGNAICATASGTCTLRAAIQEANVVLGDDTIVLPAGTFQLTLTGDGDNASVTGDLDIQQGVDITGAGIDATVIDGLGADRVFHVLNGTRLTLSALAIVNGAAPASAGGGIYLDGADAEALTLTNVRMTGNSAGQGGAIYYTGSALTITDAAFADNSATAGGVMLQTGDGTLTVTRATFDANTVTGGPGGSIYYAGTGLVTIVDGSFVDGSAGVGGAVFADTDAGLSLAGSTFESSFATSAGGGVFYTGAGNVDVTGGRFADDVALSAGGGLYVDSEGSLTVTSTELTGNLAVGTGGGIFFDGGPGNVTLTDVVMVDNSAPSGVGGGLFTTATGVLRLTRTEIRDSFSASPGGGVYASGQTATIVGGSRFIGNRVANGPGGGMFDTPAGDSVFTDSAFDDNRALNGPGGGLFRAGGGTATIAGSTFSKNQATGGGGQGGGLYIAATTAAGVTNCTFSGNVAGDSGGGIYPVTPITIASSTFTGNRAIVTGGSAIYSTASPVTLAANVLAAVGIGDSCAGTVPFTSGNDNIDQDGSCGLAGVNDRTVDPQLGPLADNGGPTLTHMPIAGSPAIDAASSSACPATDQRGTGRPADGNGDGAAVCDSGAVEFLDECPSDPAKVLPGVCGCGVADADANGNGAVDCLVNAELKARIARGVTLVGGITGEKSAEQTTMKSEVKATGEDLIAYVNQTPGIVLADASANLGKLAKKTKKALRGTLKGKGKSLLKKKARATTALQALDAAVAPQ
ncbi:MAG TPA: choice-of-anchor Q domain-containing protein [Candidatus Binatia bacterium]|jgi:CSLREA domain-containing protein|nr:choice-of-anchor Q domain-containing protein [Candidatus Binatia bacterium]